MDLINTPASRIGPLNDVYPENQADQVGAFLPNNFGKNASNLLRIFLV